MELFKQAFTIMVLGMGLVFAFLAVVIFCVQGVARLARRLEPAPVETGEEPDESLLAAAIAVALHEQPAAGNGKE